MNIKCRFALCAVGAAIAANSDAFGQSTSLPLGLPRLSSAPTKHAPTVVSTDKFTIVDVTAKAQTVPNKVKNGVQYLAFGGQQNWTQPLRGSGNQVLFVSLLAYISNSTMLRIGDAWLGVTTSPMSGYLQLMAGAPGIDGIAWQSLGANALLDTYGGSKLAAFQVLTIRLDPAAKTWDVLLGAAPLASDLPFYTPAGKGSSHEVSISTGAEGAWLLGLVMSDENPLYVDANVNGIPDSFELQQNGTLLPSDSAAVVRHPISESWRTYTRSHPTFALELKRILPDSYTSKLKPRQ